MRTIAIGAAALLLVALAAPAAAGDYQFPTAVVPGGQADLAIDASYFNLSRSITFPAFPGITLDEDLKVVQEAAQFRVGLGADWHVGAEFAYNSTYEDAISFNGTNLFTDKTFEKYQNLDLFVKHRFVNDGGFSLSASIGFIPNTSGKPTGAAYYGHLDLGWTLPSQNRLFVAYEPYITDRSDFQNRHTLEAGGWFPAGAWTFVPEASYTYLEKANNVSSQNGAAVSLAARGEITPDTYLTPSVAYVWYGPQDEGGVIHFEATKSAWSAALSLYHTFGGP